MSKLFLCLSPLSPAERDRRIQDVWEAVRLDQSPPSPLAIEMARVLMLMDRHRIDWRIEPKAAPVLASNVISLHPSISLLTCGAPRLTL